MRRLLGGRHGTRYRRSRRLAGGVGGGLHRPLLEAVNRHTLASPEDTSEAEWVLTEQEHLALEARRRRGAAFLAQHRPFRNALGGAAVVASEMQTSSGAQQPSISAGTTGEQSAAGLTVRSGSGACRSPFAHAMRIPRRTAPDMLEGIAFRGLAPKDPDETSVGIHAKDP